MKFQIGLRSLIGIDDIADEQPPGFSSWLPYNTWTSGVSAVKPVSVGTTSLTSVLYLQEPGDATAISVNDIHQGQIGDCFLLSSIGELALFHSTAITNMIHANADGTETVTLYTAANGSLPTYGTASFKSVSVTVDNTFLSYGVNSGATQDVVNGQKEIWVQVMEKAVATLCGGYNAIANGGNPMIAMEELTGCTSTYMSPASLTVQLLQSYIAAGDPIVMDTASSSGLPYNLDGNHAYMFESLTTVNGTPMVQLGNPWGSSYNPSLIPLSNLSSGIVEVDVGRYSGGSVIAPATLSIAATSASKAEGNSGSTPFTFTVTRSGNTAIASSANWAVTGSGANAASAADFTGNALPTGTVSFAAGETSKIITVNVAGDTTVEPDEGFTVTLSGAAANTTLTTATASGTILNDDIAPATLSIAATSASKAEGNSGSTPFTFTVTRSGNTAIATSANWAVTGSGAIAASAADFTGNALPTGTVSFAAGETSKIITVNVAGDTTVEPDEGFTVTLSGAAANTTLATATANGTILNDDTSSSNVLTTGTDTFIGGSGNDTIVAKNGTLNTADRIDGGAGTNTLQLSGGGQFDLRAPTQLVGIQIVTAAEGQAAGSASADGRQTVYLRNGLNVTVNVTSGTPASGNANPESITIYGATDNDVINLGNGNSTVVVGSSGETVNCGGGTSLIQATTGVAGALINGGTDTSSLPNIRLITTLEITNGGTATLNAATSKVLVKLDAATNLTLSKMSFVAVCGSAGADTITAMAPNQALTGGAGADTLIGSSMYGDTFADTVAGLNGDTIKLFGGTDVIDLIGLASSTAKLSYSGTSTTGTLSASDGTQTAKINFTGSYSAANFVPVADGHGGTAILYH